MNIHERGYESLTRGYTSLLGLVSKANMSDGGWGLWHQNGLVLFWAVLSHCMRNLLYKRNQITHNFVAKFMSEMHDHIRNAQQQLLAWQQSCCTALVTMQTLEGNKSV